MLRSALLSLSLCLPLGCSEPAPPAPPRPQGPTGTDAGAPKPEQPEPPEPAGPRLEAELPTGNLSAPAVPATPGAEPLPTWQLPSQPTALRWTHPRLAPALSVQLVDARGGGWPSRVQLRDTNGARVARVQLLEAAPTDRELTLIVRDGDAVWSQAIQVAAPPPPPEAGGG
jgi:hypothetical protein